MRVQLTRLQSLPKLADLAVSKTLAPPFGTVLVGGLATALVNGGLSTTVAMLNAGDTTASDLMVAAAMFLWVPVSMLVAVVVYGLVAVHAAHRVVLNEDIGLWGSVRFLLRPAVLITIVLMIVAVAFATLFLVVPGVVLAIFLLLTLPVVVAEKRFAVDAMGRSFRLVWSNPEGKLLASPVVRISAVVLVMMALGTLMTLVLQIPLQVLTQGLAFREAISGGAGGTSTWVAVVSLPFTVVASIVNIGVISYFFHLISLVYRDLVERREAPALAEAIEALADEPAASVSPDTSPSSSPPPAFSTPTASFAPSSSTSPLSPLASPAPGETTSEH